MELSPKLLKRQLKAEKAARKLQEQQEKLKNSVVIESDRFVDTTEKIEISKKDLSNFPGIVVGNGISRQPIDLKSLLKTGIIYGCNAQYREYDPHYLIAVDVKMVNEIIAAGYHKTHSVWTNPNKGVLAKQNINFFNPHRGWSSGPTALWFACSQGHKEVYILGFDYQGVDGKFNNIYANTYNYKKSSDTATYFGNWLSQTEKVIKEFNKVKFYRVIENNGFIPDKLISGHSNLQHITVDDFEKRFNRTIYSNENDQKSTI
jgi:hypothetical protein